MTNRQQRALAALIRAPTTREAAAEAKIGYSTLRKWLQTDSAFRDAYREELSQLVEEAGRSVRAGMTDAAEALRRIATDPDAPSSARVAAAKAILDSGLRIVEITDVISRLEALEDAQGN